MNVKSTSKTKVINLWAGPGSGKSTTAAGLFYFMKNAGYKCELVTEYAKEVCYEHDLDKVSQYQIVHEQGRRQERLKGQVDWIITDSPIYLSYVYGPTPDILFICDEYWEQFDNYNFFIERVKPYAKYGRDQTEQEAKALDKRIYEHVKGFDNLRHVLGNEGAPKEIMKMLRLT